MAEGGAVDGGVVVSSVDEFGFGVVGLGEACVAFVVNGVGCFLRFIPIGGLAGVVGAGGGESYAGEEGDGVLLPLLVGGEPLGEGGLGGFLGDGGEGDTLVQGEVVGGQGGGLWGGGAVYEVAQQQFYAVAGLEFGLGVVVGEELVGVEDLSVLVVVGEGVVERAGGEFQAACAVGVAGAVDEFTV